MLRSGRDEVAVEPPRVNPERWLRGFRAVRNYFEQKQCLAQIARETSSILEAGCYEIPQDGCIEQLPVHEMRENQSKTRMYPDRLTQAALPCASFPRGNPSKAEVWALDSVEAAGRLQSEGLRPVVLNMANASHAGGGFWTGASAQEEDLHRRSDLYLHLEQNIRSGALRYPIPEFGAVYSVGVRFFRSTRESGYCPLPVHRHVVCDVVSAAAYNLGNPRTQAYVHRDPHATYAVKMKSKIRQILRVGKLGAAEAGREADAIVLGAFGCGAFRNDPHEVAALFEEVLMEDSMLGLYKKVVFAIIDDSNAPAGSGNIKPFMQQFSSATNSHNGHGARFSSLGHAQPTTQYGKAQRVAQLHTQFAPRQQVKAASTTAGDYGRWY